MVLHSNDLRIYSYTNTMVGVVVFYFCCFPSIFFLFTYASNRQHHRCRLRIGTIWWWQRRWFWSQRSRYLSPSRLYIVFELNEYCDGMRFRFSPRAHKISLPSAFMFIVFYESCRRIFQCHTMTRRANLVGQPGLFLGFILLLVFFSFVFCCTWDPLKLSFFLPFALNLFLVLSLSSPLFSFIFICFQNAFKNRWMHVLHRRLLCVVRLNLYASTHTTTMHYILDGTCKRTTGDRRDRWLYILLFGRTLGWSTHILKIKILSINEEGARTKQVKLTVQTVAHFKMYFFEAVIDSVLFISFTSSHFFFKDNVGEEFVEYADLVMH